ncbi:MULTISPECIES: hypothetical protein [unclassified Clostridium]|uniref:hypothetical protein n=1 Tax=unclassified Clostridium TaxID=2614128 RepID=UPI00291261E7|nr:hypothetical protein [Clostridium sp.]MDU5107701.1 hypothetical protein [Clostridium sp.]
MINIITLLLSFIMSTLIFNYLFKYLISTEKLKIRIRKTTKDKVIWTIICCTIYIILYVLIDFLALGIIGFNIARGILLALFVNLLLLESNKK